ncbi:kinesin-like protein costa [Phlebotomus argentipes]|uniref:kinesin-like protein costa n=1 Tax=Phlebotomus argentipes TaxID=94469 RepID=UPI002892A690|nr:kinesin-like protein costa [Phlebotomus argentipes]XP_059621327.1 kinesin-like protein costa [Phlebotomus argentipes]
MEIPIQVAVRVFPRDFDREKSVVQTISQVRRPGLTENGNVVPQMLTSGMVQVAGHSFPVTHALAPESGQEEVFRRTVLPMIGVLLEGYDTSVVSYGQVGTGKTYTLFGPGLNCAHSEAEQGIVQRSIREIFLRLSALRTRNYEVNMAWVEICGEDAVKDLLEAGNVPCGSISEAFQWLKLGFGNKTGQTSHSIFTITLEQQWVSPEGLIQHRLSTASFCDLCGTDRMYMLNSMNQHLSIPKDRRLQTLEDIVNALTDPSVVLYNNNVPYHRTNLTTLLKDSFGGRAQTLVLLTVSSLEENTNETIHNLQFAFKAQCVRNYVVMNTFSDNNTPLNVEPVQEAAPEPVDTFGLQFAASQWFKLVSNAEGLLSKLAENGNLAQQEREQIEEWLFLKAECEECLSSGEMVAGSQRLLGPIQEADEPEENSDQEECQQNTDSDSESHRPDLEEKMRSLMRDFQAKTDTLVNECYQEFLRSHPKAVFDSTDSFRGASPQERHGRRKSIQPGQSLSSIEIAMLSRVAGREQREEVQPDLVLPSRNGQRKVLVNRLQKIDTDVEGKKRQMKELEHTISLKQRLIEDLIKNNDTRSTAKQRFSKKRKKLEAEYEKAKKQLAKAVANGRGKAEIERLSALTGHQETRLQDLVSIIVIAGENGQTVKKLQHSLKESRDQFEALQKSARKASKVRNALEAELKELEAAQAPTEDNQVEEKSQSLRAVSARISHLNHVLQEKSENLEKFSGEENDSLRHEIRNLRKTRDQLLEQRISLDKKLKKDKILTHNEERKLLTYDVAIEAIDTTIELKNEKICGRSSADLAQRLDREKGEQLLMERLSKLSEEEMRTLLYKYFLKVIDLRESSWKLEVQLVNLEKERDASEWRERALRNAVRQARLEGEKQAILLQKAHEAKLTLMMRHLNESSTSSTLTDPYPPFYGEPSDALVKAKDMDLCPLPGDRQLSKYKPLDRLKVKECESKKKFLAKFSMLTRTALPIQNLKQLQLSSSPSTRVTREKNKLIIQQDNAQARRH